MLQSTLQSRHVHVSKSVCRANPESAVMSLCPVELMNPRSGGWSRDASWKHPLPWALGRSSASQSSHQSSAEASLLLSPIVSVFTAQMREVDPSGWVAQLCDKAASLLSLRLFTPAFWQGAGCWVSSGHHQTSIVPSTDCTTGSGVGDLGSCPVASFKANNGILATKPVSSREMRERVHG